MRAFAQNQGWSLSTEGTTIHDTAPFQEPDSGVLATGFGHSPPTAPPAPLVVPIQALPPAALGAPPGEETFGDP